VIRFDLAGDDVGVDRLDLGQGLPDLGNDPLVVDPLGVQMCADRAKALAEDGPPLLAHGGAFLVIGDLIENAVDHVGGAARQRLCRTFRLGGGQRFGRVDPQRKVAAFRKQRLCASGGDKAAHDDARCGNRGP
jgi:hypothetical protein